MKQSLVLITTSICMLFCACNFNSNNKNNAQDKNQKISDHYIVMIDSSINNLDEILVDIDSLQIEDSIKIAEYVEIIDSEIKVAQHISDSIYYHFTLAGIDIPFELNNMQEEYKIRIISANQSIIYIYERFGEIKCVNEKLSFNID